jgi:hypothetical protein
MAKVAPREMAKIRSLSDVEEEDGFIEEDCSVDWASPPIYDTYPDCLLKDLNKKSLIWKLMLSCQELLTKVLMRSMGQR